LFFLFGRKDAKKNHIEVKKLKILNHILSMSVLKTPKNEAFFTKRSEICKNFFSVTKLKKRFLSILPNDVVAKTPLD
jgi:hypothetical protein